jgi:DNA-binding transcriptional regulator YhcF (GntR family)
MSEMQERLAYFIEEHGEEKAMEWAKMALEAYIDAAATRGRYKDQIKELVNFISEDGTIIKWVDFTPPPR